MGINSFLTANLSSLQSTLGMSILNMEKNMTTQQATNLIEDIVQSNPSPAPPSNNIIDTYA